MKKNFKPKYSKKLSKKHSSHRGYYSDDKATYKALDPRKKAEEKQDRLLELSNKYHRAHERKEQDKQQRERDEIIDQLKDHTNNQVADTENFSDIFEVGPSAYDSLMNSFGGSDVIKKRALESIKSKETNNSKKKQKKEQSQKQESEDEEEGEENEIDIDFEEEEEEEEEADEDDEDLPEYEITEEELANLEAGYEQDDQDQEEEEEEEEEEEDEVEGEEEVGDEDEEELEEEDQFSDVYGKGGKKGSNKQKKQNKDEVEEEEEEEEEILDEKEIKEILKDTKKKSNDIYFNHFNREIESSNQLDDLMEKSSSLDSQSIDIEGFGVVSSAGCPLPLNNLSVPKSVDTSKSYLPTAKLNFSEYNIKSRLLKPWSTTKRSKENDLYFTQIQQNLFPIMNEYRDLLFAEENHKNHKSIYQLYTLHAVNHVLKSRDQLLKDNVITKEAEKKGELVPDLRHQGFTKPKVVIVVPFKNTALDIIKLMLKLVPHELKTQTEKKTKLIQQFSGVEGRELNPDKPEDFRYTFRDNIDDCFRIGVGFNRNGIKLFTPFFYSDIIITSPLGLRLVVGTEGDTQRDFDFLSSVEVLIIDQVETILQQNWDHMNIIFENLNRIPKNNHNTDFSRVRMSSLEGWSKYFRQTMIFGQILTPEVNSIFGRHCFNVNGKIRVKKIKEGEISNVINPSLIQTFQKVYISSEHNGDDVEARFQYFEENVLPKMTHHSTEAKSILIYIPNYFEYVKIRNYFKKETKSFVMCSEHTSTKAITRARHFFKRGQRTYMLFTERFHFFYRYKIQGIKHVVFFGLPSIPAYYSEMLNMVAEQDGTVMTLYTNRDSLALERIVGSIRSTKMLESDKSTHLFC